MVASKPVEASQQMPDADLSRTADDNKIYRDSRLAAIRNNPWTIFWCLYSAWNILLIAFADGASSAVLGIPQFRKDFGHYYDGTYVLSASWQSAFQGGPIASRVVGALTAATLADRIGRRRTFAVAVALSVVAVTLEFVATTNAAFFGGTFLSGMAVAAMETVSATYLAEIVPLALRGLMIVLCPFAASLGALAVALLLNGTGTYTNRWAYRAVFCGQYGFIATAIGFVVFVPESPWWLASKGQGERALLSLHRLGYAERTGADTLRLTEIMATLDETRGDTVGASYLDCLRNSNLRRTIIAIAPLLVQTSSGVIFIGSYSTYYAQLAGYSADMSFKLLIIQQILSLVGNAMSWYLIDKAGRRALTIYGTLFLTVLLLTMGGLAVHNTRASLRGTVAMMLLYVWIYNVTLGAAAYTYLTEVATARLRAKTISIGLATQACFGLMWSFILPYLFNPNEADLGGKVGFIFSGLSLPCLVFLWMYIPETARRSYDELDEMFVKGIPARKFKAYQTQMRRKPEVAALDVRPGV